MPAHLGYVALALLVGGESLGLLVPGETALLAAGVLARGGGLELGLVLPLAALAAIVGDNIGYLLGRRGGQMLLLGRGPLRDWRERALHRGERFFTRHGSRAVFLGRWVAVARVTVPWLAGTSHMRWSTFAVWNALGGVTWVTTVVLAGYAFGAGAKLVFASTEAALLVLLALLAVAAARRGSSDRGDGAVCDGTLGVTRAASCARALWRRSLSCDQQRDEARQEGRGHDERKQ